MSKKLLKSETIILASHALLHFTGKTKPIENDNSENENISNITCGNKSKLHPIDLKCQPEIGELVLICKPNITIDLEPIVNRENVNRFLQKSKAISIPVKNKNNMDVLDIEVERQTVEFLNAVLGISPFCMETVNNIDTINRFLDIEQK